MKYYLIYLAICLSFMTSAVNGQATKTERPGEPDIYSVDASDKEMNDAIKNARQTLNQFNQALLSSNKNFKNFLRHLQFWLGGLGETLAAS